MQTGLDFSRALYYIEVVAFFRLHHSSHWGLIPALDKITSAKRKITEKVLLEQTVFHSWDNERKEWEQYKEKAKLFKYGCLCDLSTFSGWVPSLHLSLIFLANHIFRINERGWKGSQLIQKWEKLEKDLVNISGHSFLGIHTFCFNHHALMFFSSATQ